MKKLKLKKGVIYIIVIICFISILSILGINIYKEYKYHKTYEYKLLEKGYSTNEVNIILDNLKEKDYVYILNRDYNTNYVNLFKEKFFIKNNYYKYIDYLNEYNVSLEDAIRNVNIHLDKEFYSVEYKSDTSLDTLMLVNKYYLLDSVYEPNDLVTVKTTYAWGDAGSVKCRKVTYDAFLAMWNAAYQEGHYLMVSSAYRSYDEQVIVYNRYKSSKGQKYADKYAARAGSSEHQTGLALDIFSKLNSNKNTFGDTEACKWLQDNAYRFGFILRYPKDKEDITGYSYESWHYRYVGVEAAKYIYENDITFDEYYAYFIENSA